MIDYIVKAWYNIITDDVEYFPIHDEKAVAMAFATRIRNKMNDKKPA